MSNMADMKAAVLEDIRWHRFARERRVEYEALLEELSWKLLARERRLAYNAWYDKCSRRTEENRAADLADRMRSHEILLKAVADAKAEAEALAEARAKARALAVMGM
jgi:hypothetical protein